MRKLKSIVCLLLAVLMLMSLAACGGKGNTDDTKPSDNAAATENKGNDATVGNGDATDGEGADATEPTENPYAEPVYLKWMASDCGGLGRDEVEAEVKRYVKEKLNIDLEIFWYPAADVAGILSTELMVGDWDISCVTQGLFKNFGPRNLFLDLTPYLEKGYLPTAQEIMPEEAWDSTTYNNEILGISAYKDLAENWGLRLNKTLLDECGLEVPENWGTLMDFVPTMYEWTEVYRETFPNDSKRYCVDVSQWLAAWFKFEDIVGSGNNTLVAANIPQYNDFAGYGEGELFCPYFTDEYAEYVRTLYKLVQDGIITGHKGSLQTNDWFGDVTCGYIDIEPWMYEDFECVWAPAGTPVLSTAYLQAHIYTINRSCENPERALAFMEMLFSDEYLCNTLKFGIEGIDWTNDDGDEVAELIGRNANLKSPHWYDWYGTRNSSIYACLISPGASADFRDKLLDLNNNAAVSDNLGFIFNQEPVMNEISACTNAQMRYVMTLASPLNIEDPDKLVEDYRKALKANGIDTILAEAQRQLDEWRAANGKG